MPLTRDDIILRVHTFFDALGIYMADPSRADMRQKFLENAQGITDALLAVENAAREQPDPAKFGPLVNRQIVLGPPRPADGATDKPDLVAFFEGVAQALITAQSGLNRRSVEYAATVKALFGNAIQPAHFTIPSVKAEMTVGFDTASTRGVNLVLLNSQTRKDNYGQSTVSFELVSAPPVAGGPPLPFLVLGPERSELLAAIPAIQDEGLRQELGAPNTRKLITVFRLIPLGAQTAQYLFVCLLQDQGKDLLDPEWKELLLFAATAARDPSGQLVLKLDPSPFRDDTGDPTTPPPPGFFTVGTKASVRKADALEKIVDLGDALVNIVAAISQWASSAGLPEGES